MVLHTNIKYAHRFMPRCEHGDLIRFQLENKKCYGYMLNKYLKNVRVFTMIIFDVDEFR